MIKTARNIAKYTVIATGPPSASPFNQQIGNVSFVNIYGMLSNTQIFLWNGWSQTPIQYPPAYGANINYTSVNVQTQPQSVNLIHNPYFNTLNVRLTQGSLWDPSYLSVSESP